MSHPSSTPSPVRRGQSRWNAIARLAARQHGVIRLDQLASQSFTPSGVARAAAAGRLHRIHRGVYAVGHTGLATEGHWQAAVFASGRGAALSHLPAGQLWDILRRRRVPIHVTTPARGLGPRPFTLHTSATVDQVMHRGIAVTTPSRTILDLATILEDVELVNALFEADFRRLLDLGDLASRLRREPGRRGAATLRRAMADYADGCCGCRSQLEVGVVRRLRRDGAPRIRAGALVPVEDGAVEVDILFRRQRLCVEVDGPGHRRSRTRMDDELRDARLQAAGYRVVRIDGAAFVRSPGLAIAPVFAALRSSKR